ncbi:MAG: DNA-binding protein [Methylibium sp.]
MASLHVRNVDDEIVRKLKERAERNGRSAEAEHRAILAEMLGLERPDFDELAGRLRELTRGRPHTPSEILRREGRDER